MTISTQLRRQLLLELVPNGLCGLLEFLKLFFVQVHNLHAGFDEAFTRFGFVFG